MTITDLKPSDAVVGELFSQLSSLSQARVCELVVACRSASYMSTTMGRDVMFSVKFREISDELLGDYRGAYYRTEGEHIIDAYSEYTTAGRYYVAEVLCRVVDG